MLGAGYQLGLLPLSLQALEMALNEVEAGGFGRCREAFEFGRCAIAEGGRLLATKESPVASPPFGHDRLLRQIARSQVARPNAAAEFSDLLRRSMTAMPGLEETARGRAAARDFVIGMGRCFAWGGLDYAERYANLINRLYRLDRGDRGRRVTCDAVLPLAEAMLIRDPIYVATMLVSPEHRRHIRQLLQVKSGRGDQVTRRYLTRIELRVFGRRVRLHARTSDWLINALARLRRVWPTNLRGTRRMRDVRKAVIELTQQATRMLETEDEVPAAVFARLHDLAERGQLRRINVDDLQDQIEAARSTVMSRETATTPVSR